MTGIRNAKKTRVSILSKCDSITYIINPLVSCTKFADMSRGDRAVASGNLSGSMRANYELGVDEVSLAKL
jgi:hypothetical protein